MAMIIMKNDNNINYNVYYYNYYYNNYYFNTENDEIDKNNENLNSVIWNVTNCFGCWG